MGDGVNIAARLQAICEPGGVCISDDAYGPRLDTLTESDLRKGPKRQLLASRFRLS
jgi:adenylate cyclase